MNGNVATSVDLGESVLRAHRFGTQVSNLRCFFSGWYFNDVNGVSSMWMDIV